MSAVPALIPQRALSTHQGFGGTSTQLATQETASALVAAQAKATVEARYVMALQRPRDWDQVRQNLVKECRRPSFAHNKSALYRKPIGQGVEGLGIRFVEVALRCMTNVLIESTMIFEDDSKELHRVTVTDLESNLTYPQDIRVTKTVERSKPMDDGSYLQLRVNSYGKKVYTVPANDDDLLNKRAALISKAVRTLGLRVIPGDMQDEAEEIIRAIRMDEAAKDPDAERKKVADAFASVGVKVSELTKYLGHDLGACSPAELVDLRGLYGAIKDGEATWASAMESRGADAAPSGVEAVKEAAAARRAEPASAQPARTESKGAPKVSYAALMDRFKAATTVDDLDAHATLIETFGAGDQAKELRDAYLAKRKQLEGDAA